MVMTLVFPNGRFLNMTVGNPIPWGCPEGCWIFGFWQSCSEKNCSFFFFFFFFFFLAKLDLFFRGFWVPQGLQRCWAPCRVTRLDVESVKTAQKCQKKRLYNDQYWFWAQETEISWFLTIYQPNLRSHAQESADLRPAAWPGLRLVKLRPGPGVSAV